MKIKLLLEPAEMTSTSCKVIASDSLKYLGDASYESEMTGAVEREKVCDIFDVSVQCVSVYQDEKAVIQPETGKPLRVAAKVVNSSGITQQRTVVLFLDKDVSNPIQTKEIIIEANSTLDISFELPNGISSQKIINAVVL